MDVITGAVYIKVDKMIKIRIKQNKNGDSRVADHIPTIMEFDEANKSHKDDVKRLMRAFADEINERGASHDWTKEREPYRSMFYRDMCNSIEGKIDFLDGEWSRLHYEELERHHLNTYCQEDVNLIDVIEMLCDCVVAGKARSGDVYDVNISGEVLIKAVKNTVEILKSCVLVEGEQDDEP